MQPRERQENCQSPAANSRPDLGLSNQQHRGASAGERMNRRRPKQEKGLERTEFLQRRLAESERQRVNATAEVALLNRLIYNEQQRRKQRSRVPRNHHPQPPLGEARSSDEGSRAQQQRNREGGEVNGYVQRTVLSFEGVATHPEGEEGAVESLDGSQSGERAAGCHGVPQDGPLLHQNPIASHHFLPPQQHLPPPQQSYPCQHAQPSSGPQSPANLLPPFFICTHQYSSSRINIKIEIPSCCQQREQ